MEIMKAAVAHRKTIKAIEAARARIINQIDGRIIASIAAGRFECDFQVSSPAVQDELFDYLTSLGYAVKFKPDEANNERFPDSRIMNVSWEDAIQ